MRFILMANLISFGKKQKRKTKSLKELHENLKKNVKDLNLVQTMKQLVRQIMILLQETILAKKRLRKKKVRRKKMKKIWLKNRLFKEEKKELQRKKKREELKKKKKEEHDLIQLNTLQLYCKKLQNKSEMG